MTAAQTDWQLTDNLPLDERIRQRAYELYLFRADGPGSELDDWLQAELGTPAQFQGPDIGRPSTPPANRSHKSAPAPDPGEGAAHERKTFTVNDLYLHRKILALDCSSAADAAAVASSSEFKTGPR